MMDAARRRAVENLDRGVGRARGEHPVIAGAEARLAPVDAKLTVTPFSSSSVVPAAGTAITPVGAGCIEILHLHRRAARIGAEHRPFWSQRRTRICRVARQRTVGERSPAAWRPAAPA